MKVAAPWSRWVRRDSLRGRVDGVVDGRLQGWAFDERRPGRPLRLRVEIGDVVVPTVADRYRADVHAAGLGDGACGFSVSLARLPAVGDWRVVVEDDGREVPGRASLRAGAPTPVLTVDDPERLFRLDHGRTDRGLTGCCIDRGDPRRRCRLALMAGEQVLAEAHAVHHRADLDADPADPLHGFAFPPVTSDAPLRIVDRADGATIALRIRRLWGTEWRRSPLPVADRRRPG